jgi:hypothetical protein
LVDALVAALAAAPSPAAAKTMVMRAPIASTVPLARAAVVDRPVVQPRPATVAMPFPAPAPTAPLAATPVKRQRRLNRRLLIGLASIVVLLLVLGVCALAAQATTLSVSPGTAARGDVVAVTATRVPANQIGEIQLWSVVHTFPFHANANGEVSVNFAVPRDIALGDHIVKICWTNTCHKQTTLHVVSGFAEAPTTPVANTSPGSSPHPSPSPGTTPRPGSTPTTQPPSGGGYTPQPTSPPSSAPKPTPPPSPTPNPCPLSPNSAEVITSPATVLAGLTTVNVAGRNFTPGKTVIVNYYLGSTLKKSWTAPVACNGTFSTSFVPGLLDVGTARVTANDSNGRFASSANFQIT